MKAARTAATLFVMLLLASPLCAQSEPGSKPAPEKTTRTKVVKIENGKVTELEGEEAQAELKKMRQDVKDLREKLRKEVEEHLRKTEGQDADEPEARDGDESKVLDDAMAGLPRELRERIQKLLEKARKAAQGEGDVDIEQEEKAEDGSYHVKIKIVRRTSKTESTPETPKEESSGQVK